MSHFTKVRTQLRERLTLKRALENATQWQVLENAQVRGYNGNRVRADLVAQNPTSGYDIGFARERGQDAFELVADFYGIRGWSEDALLQRVNQEYALAILVDEGIATGYQVSDPVREEDGSIRVMLTW